MGLFVAINGTYLTNGAEENVPEPPNEERGAEAEADEALSDMSTSSSL